MLNCKYQYLNQTKKISFGVPKVLNTGGRVELESPSIVPILLIYNA